MKHELFLDAYYEALFFTEQDVLEEAGISELELSVAAKSACKRDCEAFLASLPESLLASDLRQLGHDFWLTRNEHGAGFWDGDYSKSDEELLMQLVKPFKPVHLYADHGFLQVESI